MGCHGIPIRRQIAQDTHRGGDTPPDPDPRSRSEIGISRNTLITTSKRSIWDPI